MRFLQRNRATTVVNPLAHLSDDELVAEHCESGANSHFLSEMVRRLMRSNERLSTWLLVFTVAIFLLTAVLLWAPLKPSPTDARGSSWVLWVEPPTESNRWSFPRASQIAFSRREDCERAAEEENDKQFKLLLERRKTGQGSVVSQGTLRCFPDTVNPRGPKRK
ncbi:MAG: hypothetical protein DMD96_06110 [Candidatus Rokuibacteriota bacterium]|nr:MAG: hypothetical protein DMD96_06110 [Candidatus Rokubacteria bacterium]